MLSPHAQPKTRNRLGMFALVVCAMVLVGLLATGKLPILGGPRLLPSGNYAPLFRISKETTVITEPLDGDGYPDYETAVNLQWSRWIVPKQNMVVGLLGAIGPHPTRLTIPDRFFRYLEMDPPPEKGDYLISFDQFLQRDGTLTEEQRWEIREKEETPARRRPWKKASFPKVAAWLQENEKALERVAQASRLSQFYFPQIDPLREKNRDNLPGLECPGIHWFREILNGLVCRAWLKTGEGDHAGACEDFLIGHRIVSRIKPQDLADYHCLISLEWMLIYAERSFLEFAQLTDRQWALWKEQIDALPETAPFVEIVDWLQRYETLQEASRFNRYGKKYADHFLERTIFLKKPERFVFSQIGRPDLVDWNQCLRKINRGMDQIVAAHRLPRPWDRQEKLKSISEEWDKILEARSFSLEMAPMGDHREFLGELLALLLLKMNAGFNHLTHEKICSKEELKNLRKIAWALAMHRKDRGDYPETLAQLTPTYLAVLPDDLFTGAAHHYRKTPDGYLLYSVGPNRIDNSGSEYLSGDPPGDDLCARVPLPP